MRIETIDCNGKINIGRQFENEAVQVQLDVTGWRETYGDGSFALIHRRSKDASGYPIEPTTDGNLILWDVTNADNAFAGNGSLQVIYFVDDVVAISKTYITYVERSIDDVQDPPDPWEPFVQEVLDAAQDAKDAADRAEAAAASIVSYTFTDAASDGNIVIAEEANNG